MVTVLIVEDEAPIRLLTRKKLEKDYRVLDAANGADALDMLDHEHVDLIIADIMMPGMDGFELVSALRDAGDETPVIFLTAMNTFSHKKRGFALGVDDYVTKPIDYDELTWRMEAILRRSRIASEHELVIGRLSLNDRERSASWDGAPVTLTTTEFDLLFLLLKNPGAVLTKQRIMDEVWGYDTEASYDVIKTYVNRLRRKFPDATEFQIQAVRGMGYRAMVEE